MPRQAHFTTKIKCKWHNINVFGLKNVTDEFGLENVKNRRFRLPKCQKSTFSDPKMSLTFSDPKISKNNVFGPQNVEHQRFRTKKCKTIDAFGPQNVINVFGPKNVIDVFGPGHVKKQRFLTPKCQSGKMSKHRNVKK